jgi:hypothetical protein
MHHGKIRICSDVKAGEITGPHSFNGFKCIFIVVAEQYFTAWLSEEEKQKLCYVHL